MPSRPTFAHSRRLLGLTALLSLTALPLSTPAFAQGCQCGPGMQSAALAQTDAVDAIDTQAPEKASIPATGIYVNDLYFTGANNIIVKRTQVNYLPAPRAQNCPSIGNESSMGRKAKAQYCQYSSSQTQSQEESPRTAYVNPTMDVYYSEAPAYVANRKPVVVLIHGGNFRTNDKRNAINPARDPWQEGGESCNTLADDLAKGDPNSWALHARSYVCAGYMAVSINYRMRDLTDPPYRPATEVKDRVLLYAGRPGERYDDRAWANARNLGIKDALDDLSSAIRYLKANADKLGIDPARIVTLGGSAGGALSMMNALRANQMGVDASGYDSSVRAAISTGATLADETNRLVDPQWQITPDRDDPSIQLYHSAPCDCGSGMSWESNVQPTKAYIENRSADGKRQGPPCRIIAHNMTDANGNPEYQHTIALTLHDAATGEPGYAFGLQTKRVRKFLYKQLQLCELRGESCGI